MQSPGIAGSAHRRRTPTAFHRFHETDRAGDVVENQQRLVVVQNRIVVSEAPVISHIIEGLTALTPAPEHVGRNTIRAAAGPLEKNNRGIFVLLIDELNDL